MNARSIPTHLATLVLGTLAACFGCASKPLPSYSPMDARSSVETMRQRSAEIRSVSGQGELVLDDPAHGTVRLDAAFVMRPPDRARVRAWKLGHAVFDLVSIPDGVWLYTPEEQNATDAANPDAARPPPLSETLARTSEALPDWMAVLWGRFGFGDAADPTVNAELNGDTLVTVRTLPADRIIRCVIQRDNLTTERAEVLDPVGKVEFSLDLSDYRNLDGTVWPCEIRATSAAGRMTILTRDITINAAPDAAFVPPARSRKLP